MCLLTLHKGKSKLTKEAFYWAYKTNPDGVWFAFTNFNNEVFMHKILWVDEAYEYYKNLTGYKELVLHFRYWTSWEKNLKLTHPFRLNTNVWTSLLFHNWVLSWQEVFEWESDTSSLAITIDNIKLSDEQIGSNGFIRLLYKYVSASNKFVILNKNWYRILWETHWSWNWNKDIWYSNLYWGYSILKKDYIDEEIIINNYKNELRATNKWA